MRNLLRLNKYVFNKYLFLWLRKPLRLKRYWENTQGKDNLFALFLCLYCQREETPTGWTSASSKIKQTIYFSYLCSFKPGKTSRNSPCLCKMILGIRILAVFLLLTWSKVNVLVNTSDCSQFQTKKINSELFLGGPRYQKSLSSDWKQLHKQFGAQLTGGIWQNRWEFGSGIWSKDVKC